MANVYGYQFSSAKEPGVWKIFGNVSIGGTGAPTLNASLSRGFASITRNSAGKYTIVLNDTWFRLLDVSVMIKLASGIPAAPVINLVSETVSSTKTVVLQFGSSAGSATDPDSGSVLLIEVTLKNSSA